MPWTKFRRVATVEDRQIIIAVFLVSRLIQSSLRDEAFMPFFRGMNPPAKFILSLRDIFINHQFWHRAHRLRLMRFVPL